MERFYRYVAGGEDKGSALRHAQMDLIAEFGDRAVPFYWAAFMIVGDGSGSIPVWPGLVPHRHAAAGPARAAPRGANGEQNRKNKVLNRDARRKEQLEDSTRCCDFAWFGTKRSEVQILSPRFRF
jgi:CHAT domain